MKIFIIGGTGYIGRAIIARLLLHSHELLGLARSHVASVELKQLGVEAKRVDAGFADTTGILETIVRDCDAVLDVAAYDRDADLPAVRRILRAMPPGRIFVSTTGVLVYGDVPESKVVPLSEDHPFGNPSQFEASVIEGAVKGLRTCIVRPPLVYGNRGGGIGGGIFGEMQIAKAQGFATWIDDGRAGAWATVHVDDLADLYVLILAALASGDLPAGSIINGGSGHISHRERAEGIADACGGLPVIRVTPAMVICGSLGTLLELSWGQRLDALLGGSLSRLFCDPRKAGSVWMGTLANIMNSSKAKGLGWSPSRPSLADDLANGSYKLRGRVEEL